MALSDPSCSPGERYTSSKLHRNRARRSSPRAKAADAEEEAELLAAIAALAESETGSGMVAASAVDQTVRGRIGEERFIKRSPGRTPGPVGKKSPLGASSAGSGRNNYS
jgi:hypothetical protein